MKEQPGAPEIVGSQIENSEGATPPPAIIPHLWDLTMADTTKGSVYSVTGTHSTLGVSHLSLGKKTNQES